jgi:hypothetical protein
MMTPGVQERRIDATDDRGTVDQHGTDSAFGFITTDLGAGQLQIFAQYLGEVA